jgi:ubiquinone/menaquinone biosynthesis C-methylase UbiE
MCGMWTYQCRQQAQTSKATPMSSHDATVRRHSPASYSRFTGAIMAPWTDDLIMQARCRDGDRVLDVACGTGLVASRINPTSGAWCQVTGLDINEGMLEVARQIEGIEWVHGDAADLPFPDGSFDAVLCQQGLQYFPNRAGAMRQMARVLAPRGRLSVAVWGALERQPFYVALKAGLAAYLPEQKDAYALAFSLNTAEELRALATDAGLRDVRVRFEHRTIRYPDLKEFVGGFMQGTMISAAFMALPEGRRVAFVDHVAGLLGGYVDDGGMALPLENHFLTARR